MVAELWMYPDGSRILELSTKCEPAEAFDVAAEGAGVPRGRGIDLTGVQQTKTKTALDYFAGELREEERKGDLLSDEDRDVERSYSTADIVAKLRRLADALEQEKPFRIPIAGRAHPGAGARRVLGRARADSDSEEIEFQFTWTRVRGRGRGRGADRGLSVDTPSSGRLTRHR